MKKKSFKTEILIVVLESLLLALVILLFLCPVSCKITELGLQLSASDYESPVIESFRVVDSSSITMKFSKAVKLSNLSMDSSNEVVSVDYENDSSGSCYANLKFENELLVGKNYYLNGIALDNSGNSLSFSIPFSGFNKNVALLEIIEVKPKYSGESKGNGRFKNEYILFKVKKSGNVSGVKVLSANDGEDKSYVFPSLEVSSGELIALHLRNKGNGCVSELGNDLSLSKAYYSKDDVRDLWEENENARLGDESDVIIIENSNDGTIQDAFLYASSNAEDWKNEDMKKAAFLAYDEGFWEDGFSVKDAFFSDGITATKSFFKVGEKASPSAWQVQSASLK